MRRRGQGERAAVQRGDLARDRQAQAAALRIGLAAAHEPFDHALALGLGDAGAVVGDREAHCRAVAARLDLGAAAGRGAADRVVDRIGQ